MSQLVRKYQSLKVYNNFCKLSNKARFLYLVFLLMMMIEVGEQIQKVL